MFALCPSVSPAAPPRELERVRDDPLGSLTGDDRDRLGVMVPAIDVVLDAGVETFRVLADHDQIHVVVAPAVNQRLRGAHVRRGRIPSGA